MAARQRTAPLALPALLCTLLALTTAPAARADDAAPTRLERPNALRLGGMMKTGGFLGGALWESSWDLTFARRLTDPLALEVSGGYGPAGVRRGGRLGSGLRLTLASHAPHSLTTAVGGRVAFLQDYGPVAFGNLEAAWELRTGGGFDLLVGGGLGMTLTRSRRVDNGCVNDDSNVFRCPNKRFNSGEAGLWLRAEAGWTF